MPGIPEFRFLTNHGYALLLIVRDPRIRIREIAGLLDTTERAASASWRICPRPGTSIS
jgi:hypothetical protein